MPRESPVPCEGTPSRGTVLLLAGTAEAGALARRIAEARPAWRIVFSLAGRTESPAVPAGVEARIGGFGGAAGLRAYLEAGEVARVVDATHPFAAAISRNAAAAAEAAGVGRIAFVRPPWEAVPGDLWLDARCLAAARDLLPPNARPFLALGRQHLAPFRHRADLQPLLRTVDTADAAPLPGATVLRGLPERTAEAEAELLRRHGATHVVSRNSGGARSYGKIAAARLLALPVVMIRRPPEPPGPVARDAEAVLRWLDDVSAR